MKFSVQTQGQTIGTIDVEESVYLDDDALLTSLINAGYIERGEVLEVNEDVDGQVDICEYETNFCRLSLILTQ